MLSPTFTLKLCISIISQTPMWKKKEKRKDQKDTRREMLSASQHGSSCVGTCPPSSTSHSCVSSVVTKNHWFSTEHLKRCTAHAVIVMGCRWGWGVLWWQRHPAVRKVKQTPLMCYNKNIWSWWLNHWLFNETLKKNIIFEDSAFFGSLVKGCEIYTPRLCKISVLHFQAVMLAYGHSGRFE